MSSDKGMGRREIGGWRLSKRLGKGGNGTVWLAQKGGQKGAMKILQATSLTAKKRFHDEVKSMRLCAGIAGVLPVFEAQVDPDEPGEKWFVMGLAKVLTEKLGSRSTLHTVVEAFAAYAETLAKVHELKVSHRDIKPDNLFHYDGGWAVGDFGLATFKGKKAVTGGGRKIGPIYYLAPEMLNNPGRADERCADVFSLAKSLWVVATGQHYPLPGSYDLAHAAFGIGSYVSGERGVAELDRLIASATAFEPSSRPTMKLVGEELRAWLAPKTEISMPINMDFREHIAAIEKWQDSRVRAAKSQELRGEAIKVVKNRLYNSLIPSFSGLQESIEKALKINVAIDTNPQNGFVQLRVEAPAEQNSEAFLFLTLDLDCESFPTVSLQGCIMLEWRSKAGFFNLIWNDSYDFIEGGADEAVKLDKLRSDMTEAMVDALSKSLALVVTSENTPELAKSMSVTVRDSRGEMLDGASVRVVDMEGITLANVTAVNGVAEVNLSMANKVLIFVAHSSFKSTVITQPGADNHVVLFGGVRSGSMVCGDSWVGVRGLEGDLGFMHDEIKGRIHRLYVNLKGLSGNGGEQGAVHLSIGKPVRLKDRAGRVVFITPRAVVGKNFLIDFEHADDY
ncbi:Serine/threonine protein kinase [Pseudomonas sp. UC 17F4]|uniref:serine/threonine protein kinase n=1 Tax=Pseudomonas sp. UC 17F4 TaxID=1855328 RepID=UPI0008910438|nr:protein kinase [Pseudomonas sp. UC 17F4]SDQ91804.1 Serine/threonine protein kinase [Pseudomonas sp. UC 17F4]